MNDQLKNILEQQLRDVHTPDAVIGWWPLAIGWWVLIGLLTVALGFTLRAYYQYHRRNLYRSIATKELDSHFAAWQEHQISSIYLQAANGILKRTCSHFTSEAISLSGKPWLAHLNAHSKIDFSDFAQEALAQQLYQVNPDSDIVSIHAEIRNWLLKHRSESVTNNVSASEFSHA